MRILIVGGDGYCGWATSLHLAACGHDVTIFDNLARRRWDRQLGIDSLIPLGSPHQRLEEWRATGGREIGFIEADVTDYAALCDAFEAVRPDAIVHFGQQRSAPFSMMSRDRAAMTLINNTLGNLNILWALRERAPKAHLVKLGTMGEYGTPNIEIEEGFITIEHKGRTDTLPFPKTPNSFYHLTKVHDSDQLYFACRTWGVRATDLHQGVVYGIETQATPADGPLANRYDYDGVFGTVLNRFCVQAAAGVPLTIHGTGGQTRAFLDIRDTVRCVQLAIERPAGIGEYRVFNQFTQTFSVRELAARVAKVARRLGLDASVAQIGNPRSEREEHFYRTTNDRLRGLGLKPTLLADATIARSIEIARRFRDRIDLRVVGAKVRWNDRESASEQAAR
jgi:UDP-sulfoquinovose synthase